MTEHALVAFVRARLDEDEQIARAASQAAWTYEYGEFRSREGENFTHILRHDPARVLRDVEAKRRIIDEYERYAAERRRAMGGWDSYSEVSPILAALATVYADHPDYPKDL